jgi:hypothetical protein
MGIQHRGQLGGASDGAKFLHSNRRTCAGCIQAGDLRAYAAPELARDLRSSK